MLSENLEKFILKADKVISEAKKNTHYTYDDDYMSDDVLAKGDDILKVFVQAGIPSEGDETPPTELLQELWEIDCLDEEEVYELILATNAYKTLDAKYIELFEAVKDLLTSENIEAERDYQDQVETESYLNRWIVSGY